MTNPFNKTPNTSAPATAPVASFGGNPFLKLSEEGDGDLPLMPHGVTSQWLIENFRVVPAQPHSKVGDAVYIDFTIEKLYESTANDPSVKEGGRFSHRINGFTGTGGMKSLQDLRNLFLIALAGDGFKADSLNEYNPDGTLDANKTALAWANFPTQVQQQGILNGKRIAAKTLPVGKAPFQKSAARFMPVG